MTDDLVKRLENVRCDGVEELCWEAADRIEQLAAINEELEAKLLESKALLAKAVGAMQGVRLLMFEDRLKEAFNLLNTTLAELKG